MPITFVASMRSKQASIALRGVWSAQTTSRAASHRSTRPVVSGRPSVLSVYNGTEAPHGFAIDAAGIQVLLEAGQETRIELPPLEGGALHRIYCHLHGAHRAATLVVLRAP